MNPLAVARELVGMVLDPLVCRLRSHRPHVWPQHAASLTRICTRCWRTLPKETR